MKKKAKSKKKKPVKKAKAKVRKPTKAKAKPKAKGKAKTKAKAKSKVKKTASPPKPGVIAPVNSVLLGFVEDYFAKIGVIALTLKAPISAGQVIQVLGHTTHFEQKVDSMQIDHAAVTEAKAADGVGIKVIARSRRGDHVYRLK